MIPRIPRIISAAADGQGEQLATLIRNNQGPSSMAWGLRYSVWCADEAEKDFLIRAEPEKFFTTPHYHGHPSVLVRLDAIGRDELTELLTDSWRVRAPKRLAASLDAD